MSWTAKKWRYLESIENTELIRVKGRVTQIIGLTIEANGPGVQLGEICAISSRNGGPRILAEAVGFKEKKVLLMPLADTSGIGPGCEVLALGRNLEIPVGPELQGRILDGLGQPIDGKGEIKGSMVYPVHNTPPNPLTRRRISEPIAVGVKAIDGLLTLGKGQRIGIFAGSGVGKSTLLGMIARNTKADINVIALVGERGREVREFIERDLGEEGLKRSVVVVATSDQPAMVRLKAPMVATAIAEYFRDQGYDVMLMMDSITRFAMAQREIGLAVGEPPATRGYTPSVFALLPKLLERAGTGEKGSITGLYTVLVDGDDHNEPIADAVRGILDGHIVLSRQLAAQNHYPAIDVLNSVSRVMTEIVSKEQRLAAARFRSFLATYQEARDLIEIGAYVNGTNPVLDYVIANLEEIKGFLQQDTEENWDFTETWQRLLQLTERGSRP